MITVKVEYPGQVFYFKSDNLASAEWLVAQFKNQEWIIAYIL